MLFIDLTVEMDAQISGSDYCSSHVESNDSYLTDYSNSDSTTSSIFGYVCTICHLRCHKQTNLEFQYE